jgi:hypothetical protein
MQKATFALADDGRVELTYPAPGGSGNLDIVVTDVGDGYEVCTTDTPAIVLAAFPKNKVLYWVSDLAAVVHV